MQLLNREQQSQPGKRWLDRMHKIPTTDNSTKGRNTKTTLEIYMDQRRENRGKEERMQISNLKKSENYVL